MEIGPSMTAFSWQAPPGNRQPGPTKITTRGNPMKTAIRGSLLALLFLSVAAVDAALADGSYILTTGRRDPRIYAIDFNAALRPQNNNTRHAIVSRSKGSAGPPRWHTARRSGEYRAQRRQADGLRHQSPRRREQCRVPAAWRARQHFGNGRKDDDQSAIRQHRPRARTKL